MFLFSGWQEKRAKVAGVTPEEAAWNELMDKVRKGLTVRTDSRMVRPGEVFLAVPGAHIDGSRFVPDAVARGAEWVVWTGDNSESPEGVRYVHRDNPRKALSKLAREYFRTGDHAMKVVGVTGTNGKTTTTYIIEHLMASAGRKVGVLGTVSYRWPGFCLNASLTTPDNWKLHELLSNMAASDVDVVAMEVSSHALDQERASGLDFAVALWTNLSQDHLDYHGDLETYFNAKARLFREHLGEGTAVINIDDPHGRRLIQECKNAVGYGFTGPGDLEHPCLEGEIIECTAKGMRLKMTFGEKSWEIESPMVGTYNGSNLLAAQAAGLALGLKCRDMKRLSGFMGVPGRLERVPNDLGLDIFVDYAHTPDALVNVLSSLRELDFNRLITIFGCGGNRDKTKRPLMAEAAAAYSDLCVLTTDNPRFEDPDDIIADAQPGLANAKQAVSITDRREAIRYAVANMQPGDGLLVAGKGHETYQEIKGERFDFSDVEEIKKALAERA